MEHMRIRGYMNEVTWDGRTLRAKGTNKAAHRALVGLSDVNPDDYLDEAGARAGTTSAAEVRAQGKQLMKDTFAVPDELVLTRDEIDHADFKPAKMMTNGRLVLHANGKTHELHFRKKHNDDFTALAQALGVA